MERVLNNYTHLCGKYLGCFCKDEMDKLLSKLETNIIQEVNPWAFALINTADSHTGGEHWMGLVINKTTHSSGYFDSFGHNFTWLNDTLHLLFKNVHRTNHVVQAESTQTCGLHTIYFIVCMMDPKNTTKPIVNVSVSQYVRDHYDTSSKNASLKDKDIVKHLSKKFKFKSTTQILIHTFTPNHNTIKHNPPRHTCVVMVSIYPPHHEGRS